MKPAKVRELTVTELAKKETDLREEMFRLRFQQATGQLENPVRLRLLRRDLARVMTIRRETEAAGKAEVKKNEKAG